MDNYLFYVICFGIICFSILGFVFIEHQKPMCKMEMGVNVDLNVQSDLIKKISISGISIEAPCGEDLRALYDNSFMQLNK